MKHKEIAREIQHRFHAIAKLAKDLTPDFDEEIIHQFRVEVKKLRAFLRLIKTQAKKRNALKIRKKLKLFYRHLGVIRNIQQHLQYINNASQGNQDIEPYLQLLRTEMDEWKKEAIEMNFKQTDIHKDRSIILDALPDKLSENDIRKFVRRKATTINGILAVPDPTGEDLHTLRKASKDIQYTWPYIKGQAPDILPEGLNSRDHIHHLTEMLGLYYDKHSALEFFQAVYVNAVTNENGRNILSAMREQLEKEMEDVLSAYSDWRQGLWANRKVLQSKKNVYF